MLVRSGLPCKWCASSDAMAEYETGLHCFSCKRSERFFSAERSSSHTSPLPSREGPLSLPRDFTTRLPDKALAWLYSHHFTDELIDKYLIGWSTKTRIYRRMHRDHIEFGPRVILPYYEKDELKFFEARSLDGARAKYITVGDKKTFFKSFEEPQKEIVIVEDMLSAMRVGEICPTLSLRGTSLSNEALIKLGKMSDIFHVWLDGDSAGKKAAARIAQKLHWWGDVNMVSSSKDPKCYSDLEIKQYLYSEEKE